MLTAYGSELVDPRPTAGPTGLVTGGMTLLRPAYECEWMKHNEVFQRALTAALAVLLRERMAL